MNHDPGELENRCQQALSDAQIVQSVLAGDTEAFSLLVQRHSASVRNFVYGRGFRGLEADEVAQETFIKVFEQLRRLRSGKRFSGYLMKTVRNCVIDRIRRKQRDPSTPLTDHAVDHDAFVENAAMTHELRQAISHLPESMQVVLGMKYGSGHTAREIAELLGRPVGAITSTLSRAYAQLRKNAVLRRAWEEGDAS